MMSAHPHRSGMQERARLLAHVFLCVLTTHSLDTSASQVNEVPQSRPATSETERAKSISGRRMAHTRIHDGQRHRFT